MYRPARWLFLLFIVLALSAAVGATTQLVTVGGSGNSFSPASFSISPGDTIRWVWASGYHNTSSNAIPAGAVAWTANVTSTSTVYTYVPIVSGTYQYECTYHSGMYGQFTVTGCANAARPAIISTNGPNACNGSMVKLRVARQPGATYQWIINNTSIAFATADTLDASSTGAYKVVVNRCGVDSVSTPFMVRIDSLPSPSFTYSGAGLSYAFTNTTGSLATHSYSWAFGDSSLPATTTDALHTYAAAGAYSVRLTATNSNTGCTAATSPVFIQAGLGVAGINHTSVVCYPNPAKDLICINAASLIAVKMSDINGRQMAVPIARIKDHYQLNTSSLPMGMYFLQLSTTAHTETLKINVLR